MKKFALVLLAAFCVSGIANAQTAQGLNSAAKRLDTPYSYSYFPKTGSITVNNITAVALATPGAITVTPTLTKIGSITTVAAGWRATGLLTVVAGANLIDGETFNLNDGTNIPQIFEFDVAGDGVTAGHVTVPIVGTETAPAVGALCTTAINATTAPTFTYEAIDNLDGTVTLRNTTWAASGNAAQSETVVDAGFSVTAMTGGVDAGIVDGDYFTIKYSPTGVVPIEFDASPGNGTTGGRVPLIFTGTDTADTIRDKIIALLNAAAPLALTASSGGAATVSLVLDTPGAVGDTNTENVGAAGFAVTGFVNPTAATTYTYKLVARLADGTTTEAGAASTTLAGHATLSATNYNALSWSGITNATGYDVYKTAGGTTGKILSNSMNLSLNDTGLAGAGEIPPTTNGTGVITAAKYVGLSPGGVNTNVQFNDSGSFGGDAGLTYDAATDTLTVAASVVAQGTGNAIQAPNGYIEAAGRSVAIGVGTNYGLNLSSNNKVSWTSTNYHFDAPDSGLRRVSAGLVGVTSGGSNLGSLQAGNLTATALATPSVTSPLTVNGTPGATTYGYKAVAYLNDGTSTAASAQTTVATGPATLGAVNNITVATPAVSNMAYYKLYRTTGNGAAGETPPRLIYTGTTPSFIDVGAAGTVETPATANTTGRALVADGSAAAPSLGFAGEATGFFRLGTAAIGVVGAGTIGGQFYYSSLQLALDRQVSWGTNYTNAGQDTFLSRGGAAATLQLGAANSATPVGQKLQAQGSRATTDTNISGADISFSGGLGTGLANTTAAGRTGTLRLQTQSRGSTGTGATTSVDRLGLAGQVVTLTESSATPVLDVAVASGTAAGGTVWYTIRSDDATDFQSLRGQVQWAAVNKAGTLTCAIGLVGTEVAALSTGTLTNTATCTTGTNLITINLNAVSSLTQTTLYSYISWQMDGTGVATTK